VWFAVLEIHYSDHPSTRQQGDRQESLITVFRQLVELLEARIFECFPGHRNRFAVFGDPPSDALTDP
jgi:hypothetical protein